MYVNGSIYLLEEENNLTQNYFKLVNWLIDSVEENLDSFNFSLIDENKLLEIIRMHKVDGRINTNKLIELKRLKMVSDVLVSRIIASKFEIIERHKKQIAAIQEIMDHFKKKDIKPYPILIKGISIYSLTRNAKSLKRSMDIDLLYPNPEHLTSILMEIGYNKVDDKQVEHEYCQMEKDGIVLDIHNYIPVLRYSDEIRKKAIVCNKINKSVFFELINFPTKGLDYKNLLPLTVNCDLLKNILIPNTTLQILILCSHIFRNYVMARFNPKNILMAELLDIIDLLELKNFDENELKNIDTKIFGDSIAFTSFLIKLFYNKTLNWKTELIEEFPKVLYWSGVFYMPVKKEEFFFFEMKDILENKKIKNEKVIINESFGKTIEIQDPNRYNSHGLPLIKSLKIKKNEERLIMEIDLPKSPKDCADSFKFRINHRDYWFILEDQMMLEDKNLEGCFNEIFYHNTEYTVKIDFPTPELKGEILILICITRWGSGPLTSFLPIQVIL